LAGHWTKFAQIEKKFAHKFWGKKNLTARIRSFLGEHELLCTHKRVMPKNWWFGYFSKNGYDTMVDLSATLRQSFALNKI
jgi:hypothetical protein